MYKNKIPTILLTSLAGFLILFVGFQQIMAKTTTSADLKVIIDRTVVDSTKKDSTYYGLRRAEIALGEYEKGVQETPLGCNCGNEVDKYTTNNPMQWCTAFASWVSKESGLPFENNDEKWQLTNSRKLKNYLQKEHIFISKSDMKKNNIKPQIGDFVIYYRGNFEDKLGHVDIVTGNITDTSADLVGGNLRDRVDLRKNYPYTSHQGFLGIGKLKVKNTSQVAYNIQDN